MYPESFTVDWGLLIHGFDAAINTAVAVLLFFGWRVVCERNKQLAQNTKTLERHNRLIETVGKILISLYPDHDRPEEQVTTRARKGQVVEMWRRANEDE